MPEYLSPGVYIEEVPARLKAIEGVSTSTAGFAGVAERGTVAGLPPPFNGDGQNFPAPRDPAPVLVTSFADFLRTFGRPLPLPDAGHHAYLARAAQGFFDNGGRRLFVSRVVDLDTSDPANVTSSATRSRVQVGRGIRLRLARRVAGGSTVVALTSVRGIAPNATIEFHPRQGGAALHTSVVTAVDPVRGEVTLQSALGGTTHLEPADVFARPQADVFAADGPLFHARTPGRWSERLRVTVSNAERGPIPVLAVVGPDQLRLGSTASLYVGAIAEIRSGAAATTGEVAELLPGNVVRFAAVVGITLTGAAGEFVRVLEIDVTIADESGAVPAVETFQALTWNQRSEAEVRRRHYATVINAGSRLVYVQPPGVGTTPLAGTESADLAGQPMTAEGFGAAVTAAGVDGGAPTDDDYVGVDLGPGLRTGVQALQDVEDIRIVAAPGRFGATVQAALVAQCERLRYRFAILDGERDPQGGSVTSILAHRNLYDTSYAAYYVPWLEVEEQGRAVLLPPSGHVAGVYARTDTERGVHKAPANEVVRGVRGLRSYFTTGEQDVLNPRGVNAIRRFEGRGIRVWGARTLASDPEFKYVNVRRFLIFLEASLDRGTQFVVFEPNAPETWSRVTDSVSAFLHTQWRDGALFGRRPEDAFFVRCDETTMTVDDIQNGRLICLIGVAIVRPAEFVIFRIEQITGFARQS